MKRNQHEWTKRTPDGRRVYRAWTERGEWKIHSAAEEGRAGRRRSGEPGGVSIWEIEETANLEVLRQFREVLWNKYQRGRVAYKLIEKLDAMIEDAEERAPAENVSEETESAELELEADGESARDDDGN